MSRPETVISRAELATLPEYSCTVPTGTSLGKRWRRNVHFTRRRDPEPEPEWMIGEYYDIGSETEVGIRYSWAVSEPGVVHRGNLP